MALDPKIRQRNITIKVTLCKKTALFSLRIRLHFAESVTKCSYIRQSASDLVTQWSLKDSDMAIS